jgi:protein TonB
MLAHGLMLLGISVLIGRTEVIVAPRETALAMIFAAPTSSSEVSPAAPAVATTAPPASAAAEPPPAPAAEPSPLPAAEPSPVPLAAVPLAEPTPAKPPPIAEDVPAQRVAPSIEASPRPATVERAAPRRMAALHLPAPPAAGPGGPHSAAPSTPETAPVLPARPVAGMESDRPPDYPEIARRRGQQGRVLLEVNVSAEGTPVSVAVAQSSGYPSLDAAALSAVQRWRFVPATRGGNPIAAVAAVPVRFRLAD